MLIYTCTNIYILTFLCIYIYIYINAINTYMNTHIYTHVYIYIYIYIYIRICICVDDYLGMHIYIWIYIYVCVCVCVCVWMCIYLYLYLRKIWLCINMHIYAYISKLADGGRGRPKGSFSIATTPRSWEGCYYFLWIAPLTLDPYLIILQVKQGGLMYHCLSLFMTRPEIEPKYPLPIYKHM